MSYIQLTYEERVTLSTLCQQGLSVRAIARILKRHHSTLYRELDRNRCHVTDGAYRPSKAQRRTRARRKRSRRNRHYTKMDFLLISKLLKQAWSPEQIVGYIRRFCLMTRRISHETIYQYIWRDKAEGGSLWTHLRQSSKRRRKRYKAYDSRGRLADKRHITERPDSVETRRYKGHWEIDTVHGRGSNHCIVTLLERKTGFVMIGKLPNKSTASLNKKTMRLIARDPMNFKSITADNGTEFHQYKKIEARCTAKFYFANPYHSWERGSNENVNGLIRQYLHKTESMAYLTQQQCNRIADKLNRRPRKRFNYKTPEEMYYGI
ncbi:MAG: IS30 family transposase [Candidatus Reddybacter sp.]